MGLRTTLVWSAVAGGLVACGVACSSDKAPAAEGCPEGIVAGQSVPCECGDAAPAGARECRDDGTLGACDCEADPGGAGGASGAGAGGGGMSGGASGASGGAGGMNGGAGGDTSQEDGGVEPDASEPDASMPDPLPDDGNQGAVCADDRECNQGLGCYDAGTEGQGFCSASCESDDDCASLGGADYTCSMSTGVCHVECEGEDDDESCPDAMVCVSTGFGPTASFRCKYPDATPPAGMQEAFERCNAQMPCMEGLVCLQPNNRNDGYCTLACSPMNDTCDELEVPSGDIEPTCATVMPGPPIGMNSRCMLNCSGDSEGCPDGMACVTSGMTQRCAYE